ncbi:hypothetical protein Dimus_006804 [Dionaea muscipula]
MTGNRRCHRRKRMIRGAVGACGTEEKQFPASTSPPVTAAPATTKSPVKSPEAEESVSFGVDLYTQARKALSERSPFDSVEVGTSTVPTLPSGLASLVLKHSDSRKKHKKSHSDSKASKKDSVVRNKSSSIWIETEEYFRELSLLDVEKLYQLSTLDSLASSSWFNIPIPGNVLWGNKLGVNVDDVEKVEARDNDNDPGCAVNEDAGNGIEVHPSSEAMLVEQQQVNRDGLSSGMEKQSTESLHPNGQGGSSQQLQNFSTVEWVLGSRNKILLTTTRPTKKRKLLGENAGLQRLISSHPCEENSNLCHFCSMGDTSDQLNQLVVCHACNMAVHQKCYGIQGVVDQSWLCSWCTWRRGVESTRVMDMKDGHEWPCVLCPNTGGALKPLRRARGGNGSSFEFAHLFCSQWMPEVYVEDMRMMEPILNVDEIKETRWKLVCNVCKVRHGTCIRCTDGACRTSFHPVCAREAGLRLEIWGKLGCDDVELRAFCCKHSNLPNGSDAIQHRVPNVSHQSTSQSPLRALPVNRQSPDEVNSENGHKIAVSAEVSDSNSAKIEDDGSQETGSQDFIFDVNHNIEHGVAREFIDGDTFLGSTPESASTQESVSLAAALKKLIERGKVTLKEVASETGISPDSLASAIAADRLVPELSSKVASWLQDRAYMAASHKNLIVKLKSSISSKTDIGVGNFSNAVLGKASDTLVVPVKSVPPRRRTVSDIRVVEDDKMMARVKDNLRENDVSANVLRGQQLDQSREELILNTSEKIEVEPVRTEDVMAEASLTSSNVAMPMKSCDPPCGVAEDCDPSRPNGSSVFLKHEAPAFSSLNKVGDRGINASSVSGFYVIPYIKKRIEEIPSSVMYKMGLESNGEREPRVPPVEQFPDAAASHNHEDPSCAIVDTHNNGDEFGKLNSCPDDEVEEELIYFQLRLLSNAVARKHISDDLICKIVKNLPQEMDAVRKQRWDDVCVNQYLYELREARKQGRKERRHREAQAVLAAATAAAAASSRISSLRKDDESSHPKNRLTMESSRSHAAPYSRVTSRAKDTTSSLTSSRAASDKHSNLLQLTSSFPKEHSRSCDICRRSETLLNPILICSGCKVAVHLDCYHSVKEHTGPWYCELCEELSLSRAPIVSPREKPYPIAECCLCGTANGAFRKSKNGQWVHAFCAEWVFESTFRRGQVNLVEGMEKVVMGSDVCCVCHRRSGVCVKCNYGNCQGTFHPSCGRSADYYMIVRNVSGKLQHKAYCEKHSVEQKTKAEAQKHGVEELKSIKLIRVELEKLRLLCERIVKREKLKRELVLCSHDILASKRDSVAFSMLVRRPFFPLEVSLESATTSLNGHGDGSRSGSDAVQKSDDMTVDSRLSSRRRVKLRVSAEADQKTDDSSTSQRFPTPKPMDRVTFAGKQIPSYRAASLAYRNISDGGEMELKSRKHAETFEKELIMTSDQASMKNRRLPKGYIYVPIDCLSNEKPPVVHGDSVGKGDSDG